MFIFDISRVTALDLYKPFYFVTVSGNVVRKKMSYFKCAYQRLSSDIESVPLLFTA